MPYHQDKSEEWWNPFRNIFLLLYNTTRNHLKTPASFPLTTHHSSAQYETLPWGSICRSSPTQPPQTLIALFWPSSSPKVCISLSIPSTAHLTVDWKWLFVFIKINKPPVVGFIKYSKYPVILTGYLPSFLHTQFDQCVPFNKIVTVLAPVIFFLLPLFLAKPPRDERLKTTVKGHCSLFYVAQ